MTAARNRQRSDARARLVRRAAEPDLILLTDHLDRGAALEDRRLGLMFVCTHPAIDPAERAPPILQAVPGIDAATIAHTFHVEPAAMSLRLVLPKAPIRDAGLRFGMTAADEIPERPGAVLDAIYAFGQGWDSLDLQATRLWDRKRIIEDAGLLTAAARAGRFGRHQCEATILSVHTKRPITGRLNLIGLRTPHDLLATRSDSNGASIARAVVMAERDEVAQAAQDLDGRPVELVRKHPPCWVARSPIAQLAGQIAMAALSQTEDAALRAFLTKQRDDLAKQPAARLTGQAPAAT